MIFSRTIISLIILIVLESCTVIDRIPQGGMLWSVVSSLDSQFVWTTDFRGAIQQWSWGEQSLEDLR